MVLIKNEDIKFGFIDKRVNFTFLYPKTYTSYLKLDLIIGNKYTVSH